MTQKLRRQGLLGACFALALAATILPVLLNAQDGDQENDPPTRVARLGYIEGSVSFQPAGVDDWVQAVPNRPMTTGDQLWTDQASRAELQLGSAVIRLSENTGFSFLSLDDHTVQMQLTSGSINVRVRRLDQDDYLEVDTPNLAFTASQPGNYRIDASSDGGYTVVSLRDGGGQATGNGQTYTLYGGQRGTFYGTDSLYANVEDVYGRDPFDNWAYERDRRYDQSPSAHYLSPDVVGYEDLDQNGDWRDDGNYGHVWFPHIDAGWAPYHTGHWDWIEPWGYTWVDDAPWGYAPFHYGRWVSVGGRWGWVAGPVEVRAVYAPALVVFVGGGGGFGGNVAWFPLGPREVYVPPYQVSRGYMNQVNISNTTVNTTIVTNVYNTTIVNKSTTIVNVTYANKNVQGAVTAVPQAAFAGAQPVARAAVAVNAQQLAAAPIGVRVAVAPTQQSVLGARASTAGHVAAPPAAVMSRQVVAKRTPPPPPVPFAAKQQALAAHPGQPVAKAELKSMRPPAGVVTARPLVKVAPAGKPATAVAGKPAALPTAGHPVPPPTAAQRPASPVQPAQPNRPLAAPQNPTAAQPEYRPGNNRTEQAPSAPPVAVRPAQPPAPAARPAPPPPAAAQPEYRPGNNRAEPEPSAPPAVAKPPQSPPPAARPVEPPPAARPAPPPPAAVKPAPPSSAKPAPAKQQTPDKKSQDKEKKEKPPSQ
jgi:hypothetical protein